jgi:hypothetical protein
VRSALSKGELAGALNCLVRVLSANREKSIDLLECVQRLAIDH